MPTQRDRGSFYENFTIRRLRNRNAVGWHWFRYIDDGQLKTKGQSSNKRVVDLKYDPYDELARSMQATNSRLYPLSDHLRGE